ncbi:hypothetical protein NXZ84_08875 [Mechercharimyces sp. CAU 1602]|nr:hypothetical protein [Mechercharimyces sp. CAU 1602]
MVKNVDITLLNWSTFSNQVHLIFVYSTGTPPYNRFDIQGYCTSRSCWERYMKNRLEDKEMQARLMWSEVRIRRIKKEAMWKMAEMLGMDLDSKFKGCYSFENSL